MLKLKIAMDSLFRSLIFSLIPLSGLLSGFQQGETTATPPVVAITLPTPGQVLQGNVPLALTTQREDVRNVELTFAYANDPTSTWFLIHESDQAVLNDQLIQWDTTILTDGEYNLRAILTLQDGSQIGSEVADLRVRNYSAIETNTPVPTTTPAPGDTSVPTDTPTPTITPIPPTSTPLPPNPAQLSNQDIASSLGKGALGAFAALALIGLYAFVRNALLK